MKYLSPLSRRSFMKMMAAGAGAAALAPLSRLAQAQEIATNTPNRLLVVFAQGGLRSADFCDAYNEDETNEQVDTHYSFSDCIDVVGDGSWMLPPAATALQRHIDKMAIIRHVYMETASHTNGVNLALNGSTRTTAAAGSVVVANELTNKELWNDPISSLSFAQGMSAADMVGPIAGEPTDLVDLFENKKLSDSDAMHTAIRDALSSHSNRFSSSVKKNAKFNQWKSVANMADQIDGNDYDIKLDPGSTETESDLAYEFHQAAGGGDSTHSIRFAAAYNALVEGICPVATVCLDGFDTHDGSQESLCTYLSNYLALTMDKLDSAGMMSNTTIAVVSDFDRTKSINSSNGTDHGLYGTVALFGNGVSAGVVDGTTRGSYPGSETYQYRRRDVWATLFKIFGIEDNKYLTDAQIITGARSS
jgi:hypothetical protein